MIPNNCSTVDSISPRGCCLKKLMSKSCTHRTATCVRICLAMACENMDSILCMVYMLKDRTKRREKTLPCCCVEARATGREANENTALSFFAFVFSSESDHRLNISNARLGHKKQIHDREN